MNDGCFVGSSEKQSLTARSSPVLFWAIGALGVSAFVTQLTLMRELLAVFAGNELVFGIVLGNWLLLTGLGSYLGKTAPRLRNPIGLLIVAQVLIALVPVADVFLLRTLRDVVFLRGSAVGVTETVVSCLVLLAPYCLVAGYLLTLASLVLSPSREAASIGQVYFLDNLGDIVGGLLFSFVLIYWLNHFQMLYAVAALNLLCAGLTAWATNHRRLLAAVVAVSAAAGALAAAFDLDRVSAEIQVAGQRIVYQGHSPYGRLLVTETSGQHQFIENGVVLFATENVQALEETVHYAMAQRPGAKRVLLISGGIAGTAREILKYPVDAVDYVELDPLVLEVGRTRFPDRLADRRIHVINTDGRLFVRQTDRRYDVVLVDVPDPSTSQLNRFYTQEFFREVRGKLTADGVLAFTLGQYENFLSEELARLIAVAHRTLQAEFDNVLILPPGRIYFLASQGPLTTQIAERLEQDGIRTHLNPRYLKAVLSADRLAELRRAIDPQAPINRDFSPILYYDHLRYWMSQFRMSFGLLEGVLIAVLLFTLLQLRPVSFAIFTTGLAASALEVVLLVGFQILYGCLYERLGLIVTMFMIGLGTGSWTANHWLGRWNGRKHLAGLQLAMAAYAVLVPLVLIGLGRLGDNGLVVALSQAVIPLVTFGLGLLVGLQFPLAGKADFDSVTSTAGRLYAADYLGAALGALLVSTLLIPVLGVTVVCLLVAALALASGAILLATSG